MFFGMWSHWKTVSWNALFLFIRRNLPVVGFVDSWPSCDARKFQESDASVKKKKKRMLGKEMLGLKQSLKDKETLSL